MPDAKKYCPVDADSDAKYKLQLVVRAGRCRCATTLVGVLGHLVLLLLESAFLVKR